MEQEQKIDAHGRALLSLQAIIYMLGRTATTNIELRFIQANILKTGDEKAKKFANEGMHTLDDVMAETARRLHATAEYLADVWNETDMHGNSPEDVVTERIFELLTPLGADLRVSPPSEGAGKEEQAGFLAQKVVDYFTRQLDGGKKELAGDPDELWQQIKIALDTERWKTERRCQQASSPSQELPRDYEKITCQKCSGVGYTQESHGSSYTDTRCDWCNGHGHYFRQKPEQDRSTNRSV